MTAPQSKSYYKYRPLYANRETMEPHEFTKSIICDNELFYATPETFNDPLDCNLKVHVSDSTEGEWIDYIEDLKQKYPQKSDMFERIIRKKQWGGLVGKIGRETHEDNYHNSSVLCLSKKCDSIQMFSYYADSHHGIAVELNFDDYSVPCGIPFWNLSTKGVPYNGCIIFKDVIYSQSAPELNYHRIRNTPLLVDALMFTKHIGWKHEEEFRVFRRKVAASLVKYNPTMLKSITFGSKTSEDDIHLVKSWLINKPDRHRVTLAKASIDQSSFSLKITPFDVV